MNNINPILIRAYREGIYVVETQNPITLFLGKCNHDLGTLLKEHKVSTAAFITAYNPYSKIKTDQENLEAQNSLVKDIKKLGFKYIEGFGQDVAGNWPREISVLVLGITESQAEVLADKYSQNGFIWIGSIDAFPSLRLRLPIGLPSSKELSDWLSKLPTHLLDKANKLNPIDQAWVMSVGDIEQLHWLDTEAWDLNKVWPLSKPDGSAMGVGTELDRVFKLIAAGQSLIVRN